DNREIIARISASSPSSTGLRCTTPPSASRTSASRTTAPAMSWAGISSSLFPGLVQCSLCAADSSRTPWGDPSRRPPNTKSSINRISSSGRSLCTASHGLRDATGTERDCGLGHVRTARRQCRGGGHDELVVVLVAGVLGPVLFAPSLSIAPHGRSPAPPHVQSVVPPPAAFSASDGQPDHLG